MVAELIFKKSPELCGYICFKVFTELYSILLNIIYLKQSAYNANIKEIKLRCCICLPFQSLLKCRDLKTDEGIIQNLEPASYTCSTYPTSFDRFA